MSETLGLTVAELVALLKDRGKRVPFEVGAFITLQAVERILDRPAILGPAAVRVSDDGAVSVFSPPGRGSPAEVTRSASALLAHLLVGAGAAVPRPLLDLVERGPSDGSERLGRFRDELEASLLPLNRGASQRTLARLVRETRTGAGSSSKPPALDLDALDADLDALLGDAPAQEPAAPARVAAMDADLDALLGDEPAPAPAPARDERPEPAPVHAEPKRELAKPAPVRAESPKRELAKPAPVRAETPKPAPARMQAPSTEAPAAAAPAPEAPRRDLRLDEPDLEIPRSGSSSRAGLLTGLFFLALVAGTAAVVGVLRPDVLRRMMGDAPPPVDHGAEIAAAQAAAEQRAAEEAAERYGDLVVRVTPAQSQVLLRVGRGPAIATNLPVGIAHEFVAIAEGRSPTRAVVPPDATWEATESGPRYELAMQAGEAPMAFDALDLGPTRLPREGGVHRGQLGSVRVLTNPPGADVYLLIGFSPEVRVRDLRADTAYELLVWSEGHAPQRVTVTPEDFRPGEDGKVADVTLDLEPRGRRRR